MDDRMEQLLSGQYFKKYQEVMYSEITEKFNMTIMEVRVLLFFDNHGSRNTAKDLVKIFHFTKSNVSKAIDSLLLRGYLKKQYDDQDRRYSRKQPVCWRWQGSARGRCFRKYSGGSARRSFWLFRT